MTERFEFASKAAADAYREEHEAHLCVDDDRRLRTVAVSSSAPEAVLEAGAVESAESRDDTRGPGQLPLEDHEYDRIDFSEGRANVPWARSVKAIMRNAGVDDWTAYLDPTLSVDEHREIAQRATREDRGDRLDAEPDVDERTADVAGFATARCDNAETHCVDGDDVACGFLVDECGLDEDEVQSLLSDFDGEIPADEIEGKWLGAMKRAWQGYHGATAQLDEALQQAREARQDAEAAAKAINGIRKAHAQEEIEHFRDLDEGLTKLAAAGTSAMAAPAPAPTEPDAVDDDQEASDDVDDQGPSELVLVDDRDLGDDDRGPSREFRAAQQDGFLRLGDSENPDEREGLGEFGARRSDTKALEEFESES